MSKHIRKTTDIDGLHAAVAGKCLQICKENGINPEDTQAIITLMSTYLVLSAALDGREFTNCLHKNMMYLTASPQGKKAAKEFMSIIHREVSTKMFFMPSKKAVDDVHKSKVA